MKLPTRIWSVVYEENHKKSLPPDVNIFRLKCTKIDFGWSFAPDPTGGTYSAPHTPLPCLVTLWPRCKIFLFLIQNFWLATGVRFPFLNFWLRIVHFDLVWLWHMIRQFKIHLNCLQTCCVHSRPLARYAADPQLQVLRGLKTALPDPLARF